MLGLAILLRRLKPDTVLGYSIKPAIYGTIAARLAGISRRFAMIEGLGYVFCSSDGMDTTKRMALRAVASILYAIALRSANLVFFLNRDDVEEFTKNRLVPPGKAYLLGGIGVDLQEWQPSPPPVGDVSFIMVARLLREKGIAEYASAARLIKKKFNDTHFVLIGDLDSNPGSLSRAEVESWVKEGSLEWPGHVQDLRPWLAQASVFVLPSKYREGMPRSIQEAMAMGRPIITTDAPGCRETVIDGENGFLVPVRDVTELATAMEHFILHPDLVARMGQASRRVAEERFDGRKINRIIMKKMGMK
jgi:glycosyltransferase involved in cell wall biosynthesis